LILVTGDFIPPEAIPSRIASPNFRGLRAPLVSGAATAIMKFTREPKRNPRNVPPAWNELLARKTPKCAGGKRIQLIGVDYQRQRDADQNRAPMLIGAEPLVRGDIPNILLSHNPNSFSVRSGIGIELSLAGHTHGGQGAWKFSIIAGARPSFLTP